MSDAPYPTGHVFIATSLDGYIAREDGALDWLTAQSTSGENHGYDSFVSDMDGIVMGSASFRKVVGFEQWPYAKPVVVLSQSMDASDIPGSLEDRVRLARATPRRLFDALREEGWQNVYVDGGQVIQSFLKDSLISTLTLTTIPILLGKGRPLFGDAGRDIALSLLETRSFRSGLVTTRYTVAKA